MISPIHLGTHALQKRSAHVTLPAALKFSAKPDEFSPKNSGKNPLFRKIGLPVLVMTLLLALAEKAVSAQQKPAQQPTSSPTKPADSTELQKYELDELPTEITRTGDAYSPSLHDQSPKDQLFNSVKPQIRQLSRQIKNALSTPKTEAFKALTSDPKYAGLVAALRTDSTQLDNVSRTLEPIAPNSIVIVVTDNGLPLLTIIRKGNNEKPLLTWGPLLQEENSLPNLYQRLKKETKQPITLQCLNLTTDLGETFLLQIFHTKDLKQFTKSFPDKKQLSPEIQKFLALLQKELVAQANKN